MSNRARWAFLSALGLSLLGCSAPREPSFAPRHALDAGNSAFSVPARPSPSSTPAPFGTQGHEKPSVPEAKATAQRPCGPNEVLIPRPPETGFSMGRGAPKSSDQTHTVRLTREYCMDSTEVTADAFRNCVATKACSPPKVDRWSTYYDKAKGDYPVNMVSHPQAKAYCAFEGKRLPTEAEWEWAAAGPDMTLWPWGNDPYPSCKYVDFTPIGAPKTNPAGDVGCFGGGPSPVRAHPLGVKHWPDGDLYAMAGNVWEWTEDTHQPYPPGEQVDPLPQSSASLLHAIRGGGWNRPAEGLRTHFRGAAVEGYQVPGLGFRCARNAIHP